MNQISKAEKVKMNGYFLSLRDSTKFVILDLVQGLKSWDLSECVLVRKGRRLWEWELFKVTQIRWIKLLCMAATMLENTTFVNKKKPSLS